VPGESTRNDGREEKTAYLPVREHDNVPRETHRSYLGFFSTI